MIPTSEFIIVDSLFKGMDVPTRYQGRTFTGAREQFGQMLLLPSPMTYMDTSGHWTQARCHKFAT